MTKRIEIIIFEKSQPPFDIHRQYFDVSMIDLQARISRFRCQIVLLISRNNKKPSHTQLDSRKQVIAFQDRVITINIKEAQHPLKREKQVVDKSSIMLKISTKSMHRVLV